MGMGGLDCPFRVRAESREPSTKRRGLLRDSEIQSLSERERVSESQSLSRGATRFSEVPLWSSQGLSDRVPQQAAHGAAEP